MIGSHETMTYLKSTSWVYNNMKKYWKCQCKTIDEQYNFGIRMFDIRVYWDKKKKRWKFGHGLVNLKCDGYISLCEIVDKMRKSYPEAIYRIWLEKGGDDEIEEFKRQTTAVRLMVDHDNSFLLWRVGIKSTKEWKNGIFNQNKKLYDMGYKIALDDVWAGNNHELHGFIDDVGDVFSVNLKNEAKRINSQFDFFKSKEAFEKMVNSKDELYFIDYCTNEY